MSDNETNLETINYRLTNIEKTLEDLKTLLITVPITQNTVKNLETRLETAESNIGNLHHEFQVVKDEVKDLKNAPTKASAQRWQYIVDYMFKGLVAAVAVYLFARLGLKS